MEASFSINLTLTIPALAALWVHGLTLMTTISTFLLVAHLRLAIVSTHFSPFSEQLLLLIFFFVLDNSVWKFNPSPTDEKWYYVIGSNNTGTGAIIANQPTPRWATSCDGLAIKGAYCFGGSGYNPAGAEGRIADLWSFDSATMTWALVNGDTTIASNNGILVNRPGHRRGHRVVTDKSKGIVYVLFGSGDNAGTACKFFISFFLIFPFRLPTC